LQLCPSLSPTARSGRGSVEQLWLWRNQREYLLRQISRLNLWKLHSAQDRCGPERQNLCPTQDYRDYLYMTNLLMSSIRCKNDQFGEHREWKKSCAPHQTPSHCPTTDQQPLSTRVHMKKRGPSFAVSLIYKIIFLALSQQAGVETKCLLVPFQ